MMHIEKFTLANGLKVIVHQDKTTPIVAFNLLYNVGAKDEDENKTGFAHLFEHLMFGGSVNIPSYDTPLQEAGGTNNAFTSNDITNYYITIPKNNLETAFWLESDRMLSLAFTDKSLEVQKSVVIEEYKQRYLNQPYGDSNLLLRPLAYKKHPYRWATIGKEISHIENATMQDVKQFFFKHYAPNNAFLCVAGDVEVTEIKELAEKWFGQILKREVIKRNLPKEPRQEEARTLTVERDVPYDAIYKAYHIDARTHKNFYATDLISDLLSNGDSSRFQKKLVKELNLFSDIHAYHAGLMDDSLLVVMGTLAEGISFETAENAINTELKAISETKIGEYELEKLKNRVESALIFSETNVLNKATQLCYFELLTKAEDINFETQKYREVTAQQILSVAKETFRAKNCSTLYYKAKK